MEDDLFDQDEDEDLGEERGPGKLGIVRRKRTRKFTVYTDKPPEPTPGFYYSYERKPDWPVNHGAYEVTGTILNTECDIDLVAFRPLYESNGPMYKNKHMAMPLLKFVGMVVGPGDSRMLRYRPINDPKVIAKLWKVRYKMYPTPDHKLEMEPGEELMQHLRQIASTGILGKTPSEVVLRLLDENLDLVSIHARLSRLD